MLTLSPDLRRSVSTQNDLVRADLPSRFASITLMSIMSLYFLPIRTVAAIYCIYAFVEIIGLIVYKMLAHKVTFGAVLLFTSSAFCGVWIFNAIPVMLFLQPDPFPKLMGAMLLTIALNHCVVARAAWMFFGILTAVPIICVVGYMIGSLLYSFADPIEIAIAGVVVVLGAAYMLNAMWAQHRLTSRLREALVEAEAGSRAKSRFLASMSHEIRTPLNAICGMSELIEEGHSDAELLQERTHLLRKSAQALTGILDDILDYAKIESGHFALNLDAAELRLEISSTVEMFRSQAADKGLQFDIQLDDSVPTYAKCDALRLRQVIGNLVSNAVKYTEKGVVSVNVWGEPQDGSTLLTVQVTDTGRGMTEEQAAHLFTEFYRAEDKTAPSVPGTGLGLSVARHLARLMRGDITFATRPAKGSSFTLACQVEALPASEAPAIPAQAKPDERQDLGGIRSVLLVDDTASNRMVVRAFLNNSDVEIIDAGNGAEALAQLEERSVDLVLLDMKMPVMDGQETLIEMARRGGRISATPVIMLTANAAPEDQELCRSLGAAGYLAKPVKKSVLLSEMRRVASARSSKVA